MITIKATVSEKDQVVRTTVSGNERLRSNTTEVIRQSITDYEKLQNLPTFNGQIMRGDIVESDPTVPEWAKSPTKPAYTTEEINAVSKDDTIPLSDLQNLINSIF